MESTRSNIAVQRTVDDHTITWLELELSVRWMGRSPGTGLPASQGDFKTPTQYLDWEITRDG